MKILLAYISGAPDRNDQFLNLLPVGLCSILACLREAGFDALLANFSGWTEAAVRKQLAALKPDIAGISQWTHNRRASLDLARLIRRELPESTVIMGGGHATFSYKELLVQGSPLDMVVLGEGEATLLEIARLATTGRSWKNVMGIAYRHGAEILVNAPRPPLGDLDRLPFGSRYLEHTVGVDCELQSEFVITARGCPSACYFCSSPGFWNRKVRFRSPENIYNEIKYIKDKYGLIYYSLRDDTFTADRGRTIELCRLLIEQKAHILWNCQSRVSAIDEELLTWMKRAGCECVQLGVESGSPRILSLLGKAISPHQVEHAAALIGKLGINLSVYLIADVPGETEDDIKQTMDLVRRIRPDDGYVSPLAYYPGTRLFEDAVAAGRVDRDVFEKSPDIAVYAAGAPGSNSSRLLKSLTGHARRDTARFARQKQLLGYCYTTNILAGEWHRQNGDFAAAGQEFREIIDKEPNNPWGWYLLGELYSEMDEKRMSVRCYRKALAVLPNHGPSLAALGEKKAGPCRPR